MVPTIDISGQVDDGQLGEVDRACRDHGFFLLCGHGLDSVIADTRLERS
jgi:isopenicillin N synthase-like dioxygenase